MACAKGSLSLVGEGTRKGDIIWSDVARNPQYPVVGSTQKPFNLCDFPLVTRETLLY